MKSNARTINFLPIINSHASVKNALAEMLANKLNTELNHTNASLSESCNFSELIKSNLGVFANLPAFENTRRLHFNFHGITTEIIRLYQAREVEKANELLHGRFEITSKNLRLELVLLSQQYNKSLENK